MSSDYTAKRVNPATEIANNSSLLLEKQSHASNGAVLNMICLGVRVYKLHHTLSRIDRSIRTRVPSPDFKLASKLFFDESLLLSGVFARGVPKLFNGEAIPLGVGVRTWPCSGLGGTISSSRSGIRIRVASLL